MQDDGQREVTAIFPNVSSGIEKSMSVYGNNLPKLRELKAKFDPHSMWNKWYPIEPAA